MVYKTRKRMIQNIEKKKNSKRVFQIRVFKRETSSCIKSKGQKLYKNKVNLTVESLKTNPIWGYSPTQHF